MFIERSVEQAAAEEVMLESNIDARSASVA